MLVCHCEAVSDREIRAAVRDGAQTRRQVARACAAGRNCGGCAPVVDEIIASESGCPLTRSVASLPKLAAAG